MITHSKLIWTVGANSHNEGEPVNTAGAAFDPMALRPLGGIANRITAESNP